LSKKTAAEYADDGKLAPKAWRKWEAYDLSSPESVLCFEILGVHDAAKRPRATTAAGFVRFYDPGVKNKKKIRAAVRSVLPEGWVPPQGEICLEMDYYFPMTLSMTVAQKVLARMGLYRPNKKPDLDNLAKEFMDACNGLLWADDADVVDLHVRKWFAVVEEPGEQGPREDPRARFSVRYRPERLFER
jgi:Holliday junction resolvase RusA-like endonuclease